MTHRRAFSDEPMSEVDKKILRAYQAGVDSLGAGNWDAAIAACAKALESIAKNELPYGERGGTLGQLLERLPKHIKTDLPLVELAAATKDPKGLGALFDLEREGNEEIARAALEVVEAFVTYVYTFRSKVEHLKQLVGGRGPSSTERQEPQPAAAVASSAGKAKPRDDAKRVHRDEPPDPFELASSRWDMDKES